MGVILGIDYGMLGTKVSYVDENGKLQHVRSSEGTETTPSAFYAFTARDEVVVGAVALMEGAMDPINLVINSKGCLGYNDFTFDVGNKSYTSSDILAAILQQVVRDAEEHLGDIPVDGAVLSCPMYFRDPACHDIREAVESVVLSNGQKLAFKGLVDDPVATVISYCDAILKSHSEGINKTFLIYDLGCSFDATVVKVNYTGDDKTVKVLGTGGDHQFGVSNWVHSVKSFIVDRSCAEMGIDPSDMWADPEMQIWLQETAEKALRMLEKKNSTAVAVRYNGEKVKVEITRDELYDITSLYLETTISYVDYTLNESRTTIDEIDEILVVGGGSNLPYVYERLCAEYGRPVTVLDSLHVVADGAAFVGAGITVATGYAEKPKNGGGDILEISGIPIVGMMTPTFLWDYYIKVGDAAEYHLMLRGGDEIPNSGEVLVRTDREDQTELVIRIFEVCGDPYAADSETYEPYEISVLELKPGLPKGAELRITLEATSLDEMTLSVEDVTRNVMMTVKPEHKKADYSEDDFDIFKLNLD